MLIRKLFVLLLTLSMWPPAAGLAQDGPLQVPNRFPLHLMFLTPRPVSALPPDDGVLKASLAVDYSSVYVNEDTSRWRILMDMELTVVALSFAYGLTDRAGIRLDVPLVNMGGGFLDGFLENYHDALGVGNYGREERPDNDFAYSVSKGGSQWFDADSGGLRMGDITLSGQWRLFSAGFGGDWHGSVLASLKLPTGEARHGYGSGRLDGGIFLPAQYDAGPWSLYLMPGYIWRSDPETIGAEVAARAGFSCFAGASYAYSGKLRVMVQGNYFSSPVEDTGIGTLDDGAFELALGFRYVPTSRWSVEFAFCEDLFTIAAPDFTIHLGVVRSFSLSRQSP